MKDMVLMYITCKDNEEAEKISRGLLEKRLIACSSMLPVKSMYWWQGKMQNDDEVVIIAKTNEKNFSKVKTEVKKLHSYQIPCILKIGAEANEEYDDWVENEIS